MKLLLVGAAGAAAAGAAVASYLAYIRPRQLRWGATDEEVSRSMPGDDIVGRPTFDATRAMTIDAAPEEIFPWISQLGIGRAGWYSYDWADNLGRPSARRILPEFQDPRPGDLVPMSPDGKHGLWIKQVDRNKSMLWWDKKGNATWFWGLYPQPGGTTRLVTRVRMRYNWSSPQILFFFLLDVGDIVMMRKCMLGIKERSEKLAKQHRDSLGEMSDLLSQAMQSA